MELKKTAAERWLDRVQSGDLEVAVKLQTKRLRDALVEVNVTAIAEDFSELPADVQAQVDVARDALQALIDGVADFKQAQKATKTAEVEEAPADIREGVEEASDEAVAEAASEFGSMSVKELRLSAQEAGITGTSKMKKDELVKALVTAAAAA
jgi:histidinol dehydrogenase